MKINRRLGMVMDWIKIGICMLLGLLIASSPAYANDAEIVGNATSNGYITKENLRALLLGYGRQYDIVIIGSDFYLLEDIIENKAGLNPALASSIRASRDSGGLSARTLYAETIEEAFILVSREYKNLSYTGKGDIFLAEAYGLIVIKVE